jgi:ribonuclease HII
MTGRSRRAVAARLAWRLKKLLGPEQGLWDAGHRHVAGVDEVGVGPLAGPVVAAAVVFPPGTGLKGVDDSKRLLPDRRLFLADTIRERAVCWSVAAVEADEIDRLNVYRAALEAMRRAVTTLAVAPDYVLVDARTIPDLPSPQRSIVGGDGLCHVIAAASILAKCARDAMMVEHETTWPGYGFAAHKGYATAEHRDALRRLGPCPIHRRSFTPCVQSGLFDALDLEMAEDAAEQGAMAAFLEGG